jgi:hypothetical protein
MRHAKKIKRIAPTSARPKHLHLIRECLYFVLQSDFAVGGFFKAVWRDRTPQEQSSNGH